MNVLHSNPPIRHHSSHCIAPGQAQPILAKFLEEAVEDTSLHPNALLTEDGPINPSSSIGIVLHNLRRVGAGLRGEHLAADLSFTNFGGEGLPDLMNDVLVKGQVNGERSNAHPEKDLEAGWQDKEEYEREQAVEQGEIGARSNAPEDTTLDKGHSNQHGQIPAVERADGVRKMDKAERKRAKKAKRNQMRKERETETAKEREG
ncbi:MAG: hypothetical protein LQ346_001214 [Caloplaca aetnensis]|nr:MAG: hypothetical protein LQ346_001214 [Caloplaca aetnensis]